MAAENNTGNKDIDLSKDALASLYKTLGDLDRATARERLSFSREIDKLRDLIEKLERGRIDIVLLGEISTGKSALINALAGENVAKVGVQGGVTRSAKRVPWVTHAYSVPGPGESAVELIDTPGLNELEGGQRAELACSQAAAADLVLFVTDSDLNELEFRVLRELIDVHKPVILVLNKADLYTAGQLKDLKKSLSERVRGIIPEENIVVASADPRPRKYVLEMPDGSRREELRKPPAQVDELRFRMLEILQREGKALVALNCALFAEETGRRLRSVKVRMREEEAGKLIFHFCVIKGAAVALNPVPVADIAGGFASDAAMVAALGRIYGEEISISSAGGLAVEIAKSAGWVALAEWATHAASHFVKAVTVGAGTVLTALPQGMAAAYGSYLVGQAARYYFEHDSGWGGQSPKKVIRQIARQIDTQSVMAQIQKELLRKLEVKSNLPDVKALGKRIARQIKKVTG